MKIKYVNTDATKGVLPVGTLGYDAYVAGGDEGRVGVGTASGNVLLAKKSEVDLKAPLSSPALTDNPTAPTAAVGTNTTQIATTEFVNAEIANDTYSKTQLDAGQLDNRYYTETESNALFEPADATILKDADIGSTVQPFDADNITKANSIKDLADVLTTMTPYDGQVLTYSTVDGWKAEPSLGAEGVKLWQNQAVTITPPSDADYTLTADENTYGRFVLDLSNWTQARNIIVDDTERSFIVDSPATNAYTATVKTSAGTGIDVPPTANENKVWLLCDGAKVIESVDILKPTNYATSSVGGTVKARLDGTTLYLRTDGVNA